MSTVHSRTPLRSSPPFVPVKPAVLPQRVRGASSVELEPSGVSVQIICTNTGTTKDTRTQRKRGQEGMNRVHEGTFSSLFPLFFFACVLLCVLVSFLSFVSLIHPLSLRSPDLPQIEPRVSQRIDHRGGPGPSIGNLATPSHRTARRDGFSRSRCPSAGVSTSSARCSWSLRVGHAAVAHNHLFEQRPSRGPAPPPSNCPPLARVDVLPTRARVNATGVTSH